MPLRVLLLTRGNVRELLGFGRAFLLAEKVERLEKFGVMRIERTFLLLLLSWLILL